MAAYLPGLQSFDSSDVDQSRLAGQTTHGGITLGSVAASFHSEDYEPAGDWGNGNRNGAIPRRGSNESEESEDVDRNGDLTYGSLLDEEEAKADWDGDGKGGHFGNEADADGDDALLGDAYVPLKKPSKSSSSSRGIASSSSMRPPSALSGAGTSRPGSAASQSTRIPSTSTAPTDSPQPLKTPATALHGIGLDDSRMDASSSRSGVLNELNPSESSRTDLSGYGGSGGRSGAGSGSAGKGKGNEKGVGQHMTLREQEKVIDEMKKENFDLKLKIHFYEQRLERLAPDQIDVALRENITLKVSYQTVTTELKRYKKLLRQANKAIEIQQDERKMEMDQVASRGEKEERRREEKARAERRALEKRLEGRELELKEMREMLRRHGSDFEGEDARAEIFRLRAELDEAREENEDALGTADDLRRELRNAQDLLEDAQEDLARVQDGRGDRDDTVASSVADSSRRGGRREVEKLERKVADLEVENSSLRSHNTVQTSLLSTRNAEKETLRDEVEQLKSELIQLENELEHQSRAASRAQQEQDYSHSSLDKPREQLERENDEYRDRATSHALQIQALENQLLDKEQEIEEMLGDLDAKDLEREEALKSNDQEWEGEVEDARAREAEARDILEEKEADCEELARKLEELMVQLEEQESKGAGDAEEIEALTDDLKKLGAQVFALENELEEKENRVAEMETELNNIDKEFEDKQALHDQIIDAHKENLRVAKARVSEIKIQHESTSTENNVLREKVEELALHTAELEQKAQADNDARRRLEDEVQHVMQALRKEEEERDLDQQEWSRQRKEEEAKWQRAFDTKDKDLKHATAEAAQMKDLVSIREADLQKLQDALNGMQSESRRLGESHTNNRFALELELERLKRDLTRYETDLARERAALEQRDAQLKEKDLTLATVRSENRDLATQLASQTQTRLTVTDKFDSTANNLRDTQAQLAAARERLSIVEGELKKDRRSLNETENSYRDQLSDRNTLLLTVYQYLDKLGGLRSPRTPGSSEPKPFNNFKVFHDSLMARVKSVDQIQTSFERRSKEIETKFADQFAALKRQQETRLRQLDRFEGTIKAATDGQRQWRQRVHAKQAEVDAAKETHAGLQAQIAALREKATVAGVDPGSSAKMSVLSTRASTAERRLAATQAQLASAEEKLGEARNKIAVAEGKWEARIRELEARLRAAEEKVKRERQGAKERVSDLTDTVKNLQGQVAGAIRRDHQLGEVLEGQS